MGVAMPHDAPFSEYPNYIYQIESGSAGFGALQAPTLKALHESFELEGKEGFGNVLVFTDEIPAASAITEAVAPSINSLSESILTAAPPLSAFPFAYELNKPSAGGISAETPTVIGIIAALSGLELDL
jgi:hypothetical protein